MANHRFSRAGHPQASRPSFLAIGSLAALTLTCLVQPAQAEASTREPTTFMEDAGWCWFQDPRAIIHQGKLIVGGLSGTTGDVKVSVYDLEAGKDLGTTVLHAGFEKDDHNVPALHARPDGSILAVYARHNRDRVHHYRISSPDDFLKWGEPRKFVHDYPKAANVTYMNLYTSKSEGKLYNFFRGIGFNPSVISSSDHGETWGDPHHLISDEVDGVNRPYPRYVQRDENTVGISFTDAHPRNFGNSIYYADFRDGAFFRVDGTRIKALEDGPLTPSEADLIFKGGGTKGPGDHALSAERSAWTSSIAVDEASRPHLGYSLYLTNDDHRYRMAHWTGKAWVDREVAYAGTCLYPRESSYTGLIALDPTDPSHAVISTDVDPSTGKDLGGTHELYSATIAAEDDRSTITWKPLTPKSTHPNLRPIIVAGEGYSVLLWLHGPWTTYLDYRSAVVGRVLKRPN